MAGSESTGIIKVLCQLHQVLLKLDLLIEHVLGLVLLLAKSGHYICGELLLELERILDLLDLLLLSLELLGLLFLLGHPTALNASQYIGVLLIELLLVRESLLDLSKSHLFKVQ